MDTLLGRFNRVLVERRNLDRAIIGDVQLGTSRINNITDDLAARTDHVTDLVDRNLHDFHLRRIVGKLFTRPVQCFGHLVKNMQTSAFGLLKRGLHNVLGDTGNLDVHLQ